MKRIAALALLALPLAAACSPDSTLTYPAPCYGTVTEALAAGEQEDSTCATWSTPNGNTVTGPLWAMTQADEEIQS